MGISKSFIFTILTAAVIAPSANAADWPDALLPKQLFRVEVSQNTRDDAQHDQTFEGTGIAITDSLVVVPRSLIVPDSRFETPLAPNREIKISYAQSDEAGADIRSWTKFRVVEGGLSDLVLLKLEDGPAIEAMTLSMCATAADEMFFYSFKNQDLTEPVKIAVERSEGVNRLGSERLLVSSNNRSFSDSDVGAPVTDNEGRVVGILTEISADNEAIATLTREFETAVPNNIQIDCSDRFNSSNYAALEGKVQELQGTVKKLQKDIVDLSKRHDDDLKLKLGALEADINKQIADLKIELGQTDRTAFAAVSAIKKFDGIEKLDAETLEVLLEELKQGKPLKPRLDQISRDLGDVNWTFNALPNERNQTISLTANYDRQLSDFPFSESLEICVTPLVETTDPDARAIDLIDNERFYLERDKALLAGGNPRNAKCKWAEHNKPLAQTKSGSYQFTFDAYRRIADNWPGLAYVQLFRTFETDSETEPKIEIIRRMVIGVSLENEKLMTDAGKLACFDFSNVNLKGLEPAGELANFARTALEAKDEVYRCG